MEQLHALLQESRSFQFGSVWVWIIFDSFWIIFDSFNRFHKQL